MLEKCEFLLIGEWLEHLGFYPTPNLTVYFWDETFVSEMVLKLCPLLGGRCVFTDIT